MEREYQIHRTEEDYALAEFWKWALAFLIGVAMGCIGFIVDWGIQTLNDFKYYHTVALIASRGYHLIDTQAPRIRAYSRLLSRECMKFATIKQWYMLPVMVQLFSIEARCME